MTEYVIGGIPVHFPFEPYAVQKAYMEKVIECLDNGTNGVLESPTGTGKTLSLLCSTLAWVLKKKQQIHATLQTMSSAEKLNKISGVIKTISIDENDAHQDPVAAAEQILWGVPKIIYASRTHSQLTQAMQEMKRTSYSHMKATVLGSRDQLCIHPEVSREVNNSNKIHLCKLKILTRTCSFYHGVEKQKDNPEFNTVNTVMDIEDLIKVGRKLRMCPYFSSKELIEKCDIVFMPYNYLLDPKARRANKIELNNTIVILDEAHNVEKMCEESASIEIKSSEIAVCIDDVTRVMKALSKDDDILTEMTDAPKDFTIDDLVLLKEMLLALEKAIDNIEIKVLDAGETFSGSYIFELLGLANINQGNFTIINNLLNSLVQYLTTVTDNSVFTKGTSLQLLADLLSIVFTGQEESYMEKVQRCYRVHVAMEEQKTQQNKFSNNKKANTDNWLGKSTAQNSNRNAKVISYWCFSPNFGMQQLLDKNTRSIILTSGTLAPLKPLIAELGIPISVRLENPHVIDDTQIFVKILSHGPDKMTLNSNYENRNNPTYIQSLGRTVLSLCPIIPYGMLIFFPSYPVLTKCQDTWQATGIWTQITQRKPIFVEPRNKDAFNTTMTDYYTNINDPIVKGAIFMAVCRGKVSEGLDFADNNGRAVLITGLPFPPLKDPRVILKKRYLNDNRNKANELLSGDEWYSLEAVRAVNQAIGRVIRHRNDYGAILLCDTRFNNNRDKGRLSSWIQGHIKSAQNDLNFGKTIGELSRFFRNAEKTLPPPCLKPIRENELTPEKKKDNHVDIPDYKNALQAAKHKAASVKNDLRHIENANTVMSWSPLKEYGSTMIKTENIKKEDDFFSRLDKTVETINFNENPYEIKSRTSLVTIHKRERSFTNDDPSASCSSAQDFVDQTQTLRSKRFKIVKNEFVETPLCSNAVVERSLPESREELLKVIRSELSRDKYKIFLTTMLEYQNDSNFLKLYNNFYTIFNYPNLIYLFKEMHRFIKKIHKKEFDDKLKELCI